MLLLLAIQDIYHIYCIFNTKVKVNPSQDNTTLRYTVYPDGSFLFPFAFIFHYQTQNISYVILRPLNVNVHLIIFTLT